MKKLLTVLIALGLTIACFPAVFAATDEAAPLSLEYDNGIWEIYRRITVLDGGYTEESSCIAHLYIGDSGASRVICRCTAASSGQNSYNNIASVAYALTFSGPNGGGTITTSGAFDQVASHQYPCSVPTFSTITGNFNRNGASGVKYNYSGTITKGS